MHHFPLLLNIHFRALVRALLPGLAACLIATQASAGPGCYDGIDNCDSASGRNGPTSESSTTGGKIKINPAAVPTAKAFGFETITFDSEVDVGLVRGNGRIGAALSPTNSEETFFGPPGFAFSGETLLRKQAKKKYPSQKVTLASAFNVAEKQSSTFKSYSFKIGLMGRYNRLTQEISPGMGVSGSLGPLSFGASAYDDQTQLDPDDLDGDGVRPLYLYQVRTYSVGLFLSSIVLDYSHLQLDTDELSTVQLYTASFFVKKWILTASRRVENSSNPYYNFDTKSLEVQQFKEDHFGGIQYSLTKNLIVGALYNYYLLREYAVTATLFF